MPRIDQRAAPLVSVLCDGSPAAGLGHVNRCLILAAELRCQGARIEFLATDATDFVRARIETGGFRLSAAPFSLAPCLIVDDYRVDDADLAVWKSSVSTLCLIDDEGSRSLASADLLLNQNPGHPVYWDAAATILLQGPRYALVRDEFTRLRSDVSGDSVHLLITCGGSDPPNMTAVVLDAVRHMHEWERIVVLLGPGYGHHESLRTIAAGDPRVQPIVDPPDVGRVMAACRLAVTAAGSTCYELACLGIPFVTITAARNQLAVAIPLHAEGYAPYVGPAGTLDAGCLHEALRAVAADWPNQSAGLRQLVDGRGPERVAGAVLSLLGAPSVVPMDLDAPGRLAVLVELDKACVSEMAESYSNVEWSEENFLRSLPGKSELSVCAMAGQECIGFWVASLHSSGDCHTHRVAVAGRAREQGIGRRLFAAVERRGRLLGARRMTLEVGTGNHRAQRFYENLGFEALREPAIRQYLAARQRTAEVFDAHLRESDGSTFIVMARPL